MTQTSMTETPCWPDGARLAVCIVVDLRVFACTISGHQGDRRIERILRLLNQRDLAASVIVDHAQQIQLEERFHCLYSAVSTESNAVLANFVDGGDEGGLPNYELLVVDSAEPHWRGELESRRLVVPFDPNCCDQQMLAPLNWTPDEWLQYVMDGFDCLHLESDQRPSMLGLHLTPQASGRSGAVQALSQLLCYIQQRESVWIADAQQIARHYQQVRAQTLGISR